MPLPLSKKTTRNASSWRQFATKCWAKRRADVGQPYVIQCRELEPRILFSATPLSVLGDAGDLSAENSTAAGVASLATEATGGGLAEPSESLLSPSLTMGEGIPLSAFEIADGPHQLFVVDESVVDLLDGLDINGGELLIISEGDDVFAEIASALDSGRPYDAVHIFSHADRDGLWLGGQEFTADTLKDQQATLQSWSGNLSYDADILLYGCDLASTDAGRDVVELIAQHTGADVAASVDATGHGSLNGDWDLEFATGSIETESLSVGGFVDTLATITVTNTNNSGAGSLREAITAANMMNGADVIEFDISGEPVNYYQDNFVADSVTTATTTTGPVFDADPDFPGGWFSIRPTSALPTIDETLVIAGGTQGNLHGLSIAIELSGQFQATGDGLQIDSNDVTIRDLTVNRFNADGIQISSGANNRILGNNIGTDVSGLNDLGNGGNGIHVQSDSNFIGDGSANGRNVISGNGTDGISVSDADSTDIVHNYVGVNSLGETALGNDRDGIRVLNGSQRTFIEGNVVSGNFTDGIAIAGVGTTDTHIEGNLIGLDRLGTTAIGNLENGIDITAPQTTVGGAGASEGNIISGNGAVGIRVQLVTTTDVTIEGNIIGGDITDTVGIGNGSHGILVRSASGNINIGGNDANQANTIRDNLGDGIFVDNNATGVAIGRNSIFDNLGLGIDLETNGVTANDVGDADGGANGQQNYPSFVSIALGPDDVTLAGTIESTANTSFRLRFFTVETADPTGFGEGKDYLGSVDLTTDGSGNATFQSTFDEPGLAPTTLFTMTATGPQGTSEFTLANSANTPFLSLDDDGSSGGGNFGFAAAYIEDQAAIAIADSDVVLVDVDGSDIVSMTVQLTNAQVGDILTFVSVPAGLVGTSNGTQVTITGASPPAAYQSILTGLRFSSSSQNPVAGDRLISLTVVDSDTNQSFPVTATINVVPVNDPPVAVADRYVTANTETLIVAAPGLQLNDSDVDSASLTVSLVTPPENGTLTLNPDGSFIYRPFIAYVGDVSFTYELSDGELSQVVAVTIQVVSDQGGISGGAISRFIENQSINDDAASLDLTASNGTDDLADDGRSGANQRQLGIGAARASSQRPVVVVAGVSDTFQGGEIATPYVLQLVESVLDANQQVAASKTLPPPLASGADLWQQVDDIRTEARDEIAAIPIYVVGTATIVTAAATAGYALWALRSGSILAMLASTFPTWMAFDPLPILDAPLVSRSEHGESLEDLLAPRLNPEEVTS
jgi:hypothetical protein